PPSGAPRKWGGNGEKSYVSQSRSAHRLPRQGARETPSPRKRHELHRAVRRTQQSWKDASEEWHSRTEWHRVVAFNRLGEAIAQTLHKGDHVLVDGMLVSSRFERENGKSKKGKAAKHVVFWSVRANSV